MFKIRLSVYITRFFADIKALCRRVVLSETRGKKKKRLLPRCIWLFLISFAIDRFHCLNAEGLYTVVMVKLCYKMNE